MWRKAKNKPNFGLRGAWNVVSNIAVFIIAAWAIAMISLRLAGFNVYTVMSGSMEPNYPVGSLIYVKPAEPSNLKEGDVITFLADENTIVTHRIVETVTETNEAGKETLRFRTKGDANNTPDGKLVHYRNILGTPSFAIPLLGYLSFYLQRPPGSYIALILGTFLIALIIIPHVAVSKRKEQLTKEPISN